MTLGVRPFLGAALVLALAVAPGATGSLTAASTHRATYSDARGEDPAAPDITSVQVSNDDAGLITLRVDIPTHPVLTQDMRLRIRFWDDDPTTRLPPVDTPNFFILVDAYLLGLGNASMYQCRPVEDGAVCEPPQHSSSSSALAFSYANGVARFLVPSDVVGIPVKGWGVNRLEFVVSAGAGYGYDPANGFDVTNAHVDTAPAEDARWTYSVRIGPSRLIAKRFGVGPSPATAGEPLVVTLRAIRDDTGAAVTTGNVSCSAKIAGHPLRPRFRGFAAKTAVCWYRLPSNAHGARVRGSLAVTFAGKTVTRSFVQRIR